MATNFTQDFFTSRRNFGDGNVRVGELDRLWYDPNTNTIRIGDGSPGGKIVSGEPANIAVFNGNSLLTSNVSSLNFTGNALIANAVGNSVTVTMSISSYIFDGGAPDSNYGVGPAFDCGGVT